MILNRASDGLASVLVALHRALVAYGPQREDRLLALCAPTSAVGEKQEKARQTLTRWTQLGMFQNDAETLSLEPSVATISGEDLDRFRCAALRFVLRPENNAGLAAPETNERDDGGAGGDASDFTRAACWMLTQDPYAFEPSWERGVQPAQHAQGVKPQPFGANSTRWNGFEEWARFLGLAVNTRGKLIMNPAFAIGGVLDGLFDGAEVSPQSLFLRRLGQALPVLDGGTFRTLIEASIVKPWRPVRENAASPTLSLALLHLEAAGALRLESRSDASQCVLLGRGVRDLRHFSHVVRLREDCP
jgi:hypothetical protein